LWSAIGCWKGNKNIGHPKSLFVGHRCWEADLHDVKKKKGNSHEILIVVVVVCSRRWSVVGVPFGGRWRKLLRHCGNAEAGCMEISVVLRMVGSG